jgi:adenylate kinase
MKIVIMGVPSCGKGVQAKLIEENFGFANISTGQILRDFVNQNNKKSDKINKIIKKGAFVSDSIMNKIVREKLANLENQDYLLDGYPRTIKQAKYLIKHNIPDMVIFLQTDKEIAIERVSNRLVCPKCKKSYSKKDLKEYVCTDDGTALVVREDDNPEVYLRRLEIFEKETKRILELFKREGVLEFVSNNGDVKETFTEIAKLLIEKGDVYD